MKLFVRSDRRLRGVWRYYVFAELGGSYRTFMRFEARRQADRDALLRLAERLSRLLSSLGADGGLADYCAALSAFFTCRHYDVLSSLYCQGLDSAGRELSVVLGRSGIYAALLDPSRIGERLIADVELRLQSLPALLEGVAAIAELLDFIQAFADSGSEGRD